MLIEFLAKKTKDTKDFDTTLDRPLISFAERREAKGSSSSELLNRARRAVNPSLMLDYCLLFRFNGAF